MAQSRGLLFNVENPYEAATGVYAQSSQTMGAQQKKKTVHTEKDTTVGDVINTGLSLALAGATIKDMAGKSTEWKRALEQEQNVTDMIAAKNTPAPEAIQDMHGGADAARVAKERQLTKEAGTISGSGKEGAAYGRLKPTGGVTNSLNDMMGMFEYLYRS